MRDWIKKEWKRIRHNSLARNAGWMLAGQGSNLFLQAAYFVLLSRLLGNVEYGIFVGAFALTSFVATYTAMGSGTLFLRYVSSTHGKFAVYWGNILFSTGVVSAILITAASFAAPHLLNPASASLVVITAIGNCLFGETTRNAAAVFQAFEKMKVTATLNLATSLARLFAVAGMFEVLHHATAFQWAIASLIVSAMAATAAIVVVTVSYGWPTFSASLMVKTTTEGFGYSFASSTASVYNDIDKTMLSHYGMNAANGIYALAYRVIDIGSIPVFAVRDAATPRLFRLGSSNATEVKDLAFRLMSRALLVSLLISITLYFAAPLLPLLAGQSFAESQIALRWLCLIPILRSVHQMAGSAIMGMGKQSYRTATQITVAIVNFLLNLWFIPTYGWRGAAWTSLLADSLLGALNVLVLLWLCRSQYLNRALRESSSV